MSDYELPERDAALGHQQYRSAMTDSVVAVADILEMEELERELTASTIVIQTVLLVRQPPRCSGSQFGSLCRGWLPGGGSGITINSAGGRWNDRLRCAGTNSGRSRNLKSAPSDSTDGCIAECVCRAGTNACLICTIATTMDKWCSQTSGRCWVSFCCSCCCCDSFLSAGVFEDKLCETDLESVWRAMDPESCGHTTFHRSHSTPAAAHISPSCALQVQRRYRWLRLPVRQLQPFIAALCVV